ncbi:hypothetical protein FE257_012119 [Aspergillus nanangensis]|uniref:FAD-binding PCMH-type domain-containing protein n=1 Tax=Aspergillus nanangensis TaxID=2582783 RepID=A0AAD4GR15_ASPNN|nr:hypothetical protein FE257_012119 [Aspergillus nanangensis]
MYIFMFVAAALLINVYASTCRCRSHEPCWPTEAEWNAFNHSINGHLQHVRPVGHVCHGDGYDPASCEYAKSHTNNTLWRVSEPGALIPINWESDPSQNEECWVVGPQTIPCGQGRIPPFAVLAETAQEIQATVRFARERNVRVVRNTGHDSNGKSSGVDALQINMSKLKQIRHTSDFIPTGGGSASLGQAVTLGAGVMGFELLDAAADAGFIALAGLCPTVGVAGGFIQGGGHSVLAPLYGVASDNALEFEVVTAQGDLVVANQFQNPDLYWAFRGGGGGTFGVAVHTTVQTFPDIPAVRVSLDIQVPLTSAELAGQHGNADIWHIIEDIVDLIATLNTGTNSADLTITPTPSTGNQSQITFTTYMTGAGSGNPIDIHDADAQFAPLRSKLDARRGVSYSYSSTPYAYLSTAVAEPTPFDRWGVGFVEGSVFLSDEFSMSTAAPHKIAKVLSQIQFWPGNRAEILIAGGGRVKANKAVVESALLPAWRDALLMMTVRRYLGPTPSPEAQREFRREMTSVVMPLMRSLERDSLHMGSYLNLADPDEPRWKEAFWGRNYPRLYRVKQTWDADGVFVVRHGVGSEDWHDEGLCRRA